MLGINAHSRPLLVLLLCAGACAVLCAMIPKLSRPPRPDEAGALPVILPVNAFQEEGSEVRIRSEEGQALWVATDNRLKQSSSHGSDYTLKAHADMRNATRALATPTAIQWRHPRPGLPAAMVVRAAQARAVRHAHVLGRATCASGGLHQH